MKKFKQFLNESYSSEDSPPPPPPVNTVREFDKYREYNVDQNSEMPRPEPPFVEEDMPWDSNDPLWSDPDFLNFIRQLYDLRQNRGNQEWFRARYGEITAENNFLTQMMNLIYSLRWTLWWRTDPVSGRLIRLRIPELNDPRWDQIFK